MEAISKMLQSYINNPSYTWVPIVVFVLTISIGAVMGFLNGWKTSLYFFGWNLTGWISGVFLLPTIISAVENISFVKLIIGTAKDLLGVIALFVFLLITNFLAFLVYWIFRKKLKKTMSMNKVNKISNKYSRFLGAGIAISSSIPSAVFLANSSAIMSTESGYTNFLDSMTDKLTFGKYKGSSEARVLVSNVDYITNFISAIAKNAADGPGNLGSEASCKALQAVLNTNFVNHIDDIYDGIKSAGMIGSDDVLSKVTAKDLDTNLPSMGIVFGPGKENALKQSLSKMFSDQTVVSKIMEKLKASPPVK